MSDTSKNTGIPYNYHYYWAEQDRLQQKYEEEGVRWEYVKGSDGYIIRTNTGFLMVNGDGEYASDTGFHLVQVTGHEVQQARVKHELRIAGFMQ